MNHAPYISVLSTALLAAFSEASSLAKLRVTDVTAAAGEAGDARLGPCRLGPGRLGLRVAESDPGPAGPMLGCDRDSESAAESLAH